MSIIAQCVPYAITLQDVLNVINGSEPEVSLFLFPLPFKGRVTTAWTQEVRAHGWAKVE